MAKLYTGDSLTQPSDETTLIRSTLGPPSWGWFFALGVGTLAVGLSAGINPVVEGLRPECVEAGPQDCSLRMWVRPDLDQPVENGLVGPLIGFGAVIPSTVTPPSAALVNLPPRS